MEPVAAVPDRGLVFDSLRDAGVSDSSYSRYFSSTPSKIVITEQQ